MHTLPCLRSFGVKKENHVEKIGIEVTVQSFGYSIPRLPAGANKSMKYEG